jgi:hypothetical protein
VLFGSAGLIVAQSESLFSDPEPLNTNADIDAGPDLSPQMATDGLGNWIVVWQSEDSLGGVIGTDQDILMARSTDYGRTWTDPAPLTAYASIDDSYDQSPQLTTDSAGHWVAVWFSSESLGGTIGTEMDILVARSTDNGQTWTDPVPLNTNADSDLFGDRHPQLATDGAGTWIAVWVNAASDLDIYLARSTDNGQTWTDPEFLTDPDIVGFNQYPQVTTDGAGNWIVVWVSRDTLGDTIGIDDDILVARSTDNGETWTDPAALNTTAFTDTQAHTDRFPQVTTDRAGRWIAVWNSPNTLGGTIGIDEDILTASSTDNGETWTDPVPLDHNAYTDGTADSVAQLTTNGTGHWVAAWTSRYNNGGPTGIDSDILVTTSTDNGQTWSDAVYLNNNAYDDSGHDGGVEITTGGPGPWIAVWVSGEDVGGTIGTDGDILIARMSSCRLFIDESAYGRLLFAPRCSEDASSFVDDVYDTVAVRVDRGANDFFYLSSEDLGFAPLAGDDEIHIEGVDSGFGPYEHQPAHQGGPPYPLDIAIEGIWVPQLADDAGPGPGLIPGGSTEVLFELLDADREICGNTALYLIRDCGIYTEKAASTTLHWVSYAVEVDSLPSDLDVVSGTISELRGDAGFARACFLGSFIDTEQVVDTRPDPPAGEGYYYLIDGTCGQLIGYGDSSLVPDVRDTLPPGALCQ